MYQPARRVPIDFTDNRRFCDWHFLLKFEVEYKISWSQWNMSKQYVYDHCEKRTEMQAKKYVTSQPVNPRSEFSRRIHVIPLMIFYAKGISAYCHTKYVRQPMLTAHSTQILQSDNTNRPCYTSNTKCRDIYLCLSTMLAITHTAQTQIFT